MAVARIIKIIPGKDAKVRVCDVQKVSGMYRQYVKKYIFLWNHKIVIKNVIPIKNFK